MDDNTLLAQTLETSKKNTLKWETELVFWIVFILEELDINLDMGIDEMKNKLVKRSMENWEKQVKENAIVKHGKLRTYYTFKNVYLFIIANSAYPDEMLRYASYPLVYLLFWLRILNKSVWRH